MWALAGVIDRRLLILVVAWRSGFSVRSRAKILVNSGNFQDKTGWRKEKKNAYDAAAASQAVATVSQSSSLLLCVLVGADEELLLLCLQRFEGGRGGGGQ